MFVQHANTLAALTIAGGTGSPLNPLAIFQVTYNASLNIMKGEANGPELFRRVLEAGLASS
jgi:hypothetical protein